MTDNYLVYRRIYIFLLNEIVMDKLRKSYPIREHLTTYWNNYNNDNTNILTDSVIEEWDVMKHV